MKAVQFDTPAKANAVLKLAVISDGHIDSPFFDFQAFVGVMNGIKAEKRLVLINGDLFDAILRTDMKRGANHLMEKTDDQINQKVKRVVELLRPYQENILFVGRGNHCLLADTEVLTADGFKPIIDITESDFVANYDVDNDTIVYDNPEQIHHIDYDGEIYLCESQVLNFGVSPDHRMFGISQQGKPYYRLAKDFSVGATYKAKVSVESKSIGVSLSDDELRLLGWLLTDAYIPNKAGAIIYQSKEKYVSEIRNLLDRMRIDYKETIRNRNIKSICGKVLKSIKPQYEFRLHIDSVRKLQNLAKSGDWFGVIRNTNQSQFKVFFNTIVDADGNRPSSAKTCCALHGRKEILEKFQILCFLHGIRASLSISTRGHYVLNCTETTTAEIRKWGESTKKIKNPFDKIYCLTMPHSNFVVRRKGRIMITGNCSSVIKFNGIDLIDLVCEMLNAGSEHKIICGNYSNWLRFNWYSPNGKSAAHYDIYMHHGSGSVASVTKGMIDFDRLASSVDADLVIIGHKHNAIVDYSHPLQKLTGNGEFVLKNRIFLQTPSFQVPRKIDQNDNFNEKFYTNQAMAGYASVDLSLKTTHNGHYRVIPDVKLVIKPEHIVGNLEVAALKKKISKVR